VADHYHVYQQYHHQAFFPLVFVATKSADHQRVLIRHRPTPVSLRLDCRYLGESFEVLLFIFIFIFYFVERFALKMDEGVSSDQERQQHGPGHACACGYHLGRRSKAPQAEKRNVVF
jgi:hypothetical protein